VAEYDRVVRAGAYIQGARMAFSSEPPNKAEAMSRLGAAYTELRFSIAGEMGLMSPPAGVHLDSQTKDMLKGVNEVVNFLALGVDMVEYQYVPKLFPNTSITMSGDYQSIHWRTYEDLDEKVFEVCVNFVDKLMKKAEELARKAEQLKQLFPRR
jgi:hypothetical protein